MAKGKKDVEARIEEIRKRAPSSWRNQAEWTTVYLLEEILRELVELKLGVLQGGKG